MEPGFGAGSPIKKSRTIDMRNEKKSVFIVGAFGYCNNQLDGQTIKTRNILKLMQVRYQGTVSFFDTLSTRKHPLGIFKLFSGLIHCHTLLLVPCRGNLAYFLPVAYCLSKLFRYEIIVICVGGWQIEYFTGKQGYRAHKLAMQCCKNIKAHLPEMLSVHNELTTHYGFRNSEVFPNFRFFNQAPVTENSGTLRLVYLARIRTEKGFASIFKALDILKAKNIDVSIDFYGQIYDRDKKDFMSLISSHKDNAHYCEAIDPKHINERLRQYDVMLLPVLTARRERYDQKLEKEYSKNPFHSTCRIQFIVVQGSEELAAVLQTKETRHKEDYTGHDHGDAVFEQDDAPDSRIDVIRFLVWVDSHVPDLVLDEGHARQDERQYDRKHRQHRGGITVADERGVHEGHVAEQHDGNHELSRHKEG